MTTHDPRDADIDLPVNDATVRNTTGGTATRKRRVFLGVGQRGEHRPRTFTHPSVIDGIASGASWADPEMDPTRIDWASRQAVAAIPFAVVDGRPVNPCEQTGVRYGRNECGHWGEARTTDTLVTLNDRFGYRWALMVERADGHGWALPGGHVEAGEKPKAAAVRELEEEAGLSLVDHEWQMSPPRYVPDPRASDEAWMVTVLARTHLGTYGRSDFPKVVGADDAKRAAWVWADTYVDLVGYLAETVGGRVFAAHRDMLVDALNNEHISHQQRN